MNRVVHWYRLHNYHYVYHLSMDIVLRAVQDTQYRQFLFRHTCSQNKIDMVDKDA